MKNLKVPSRPTRINWFTDAVLLVGAVLATLTSIYFLYLPTGGYQGGRNPLYGVRILWDRSTWHDLHIWGGVLMIAAAAVHLVLHWNWLVSMSKRIVNEMRGKCACMNRRGHFNVALDMLLAVSFLLTALSGLYFLFLAPEDSRTAPHVLFSQTTWDLIHTWAGVVMIIAAVIHFAIHWGWIVKVSRNVLTYYWQPQAQHLKGKGATSPLPSEG